MKCRGYIGEIKCEAEDYGLLSRNLKMGAADSSQTLVPIYKTMWQHI
jgi:hypothetical protein